MRDTVIILGSAETKTSFDFERADCDIWVFNEAMHAAWCKRADAVFQMHLPIIWRSSQNRNDPKHYEWLKAGDTPTIYMTDKYDDVPKSEAYPIDEVKATFPRMYFTSSVAYAIALATLREYKHIEIYGVEMATSTEYWHQREGVAYWIGYAEGRGIDVKFNSRSMLQSPLYGYEGQVNIPIGFYEDRITALSVPLKQHRAEYEKAKLEIHALLDEFVKNFKADVSTFNDKMQVLGQSAHNFSVVDGMCQVNTMLLAKAKKMQDEVGNYMIARQEFDDMARNTGMQSQKMYLAIKVESTKLEEIRNQFKNATNKDVRRQLVIEFKKQLGKYIQKINMNGVLQGSGLESTGLMHKLDELIRMAGGSKAEEIMVNELKATLVESEVEALVESPAV